MSPDTHLHLLHLHFFFTFLVVHCLVLWMVESRFLNSSTFIVSTTCSFTFHHSHTCILCCCYWLSFTFSPEHISTSPGPFNLLATLITDHIVVCDLPDLNFQPVDHHHEKKKRADKDLDVNPPSPSTHDSRLPHNTKQSPLPPSSGHFMSLHEIVTHFKFNSTLLYKQSMYTYFS